MRIVRSGAWIALLALGCSGTGSSTDGVTPEEGATQVAKISYLRFDFIQNPQTGQKKWIHTYRLMLSESWRAKRGPANAKDEPFLRLYMDPYLSDAVPDSVMAGLLTEIRRKGFDQLQETPVEMINLEALRRAEREGNKDVLKWKRIIFVETDTWKRCITCEDNDDTGRGSRPPGPKTKAFLEVERAVLSVATGYTIQVTVEKDPTKLR